MKTKDQLQEVPHYLNEQKKYSKELADENVERFLSELEKSILSVIPEGGLLDSDDEIVIKNPFSFSNMYHRELLLLEDVLYPFRSRGYGTFKQRKLCREFIKRLHQSDLEIDVLFSESEDGDRIAKIVVKKLSQSNKFYLENHDWIGFLITCLGFAVLLYGHTLNKAGVDFTILFSCAVAGFFLAIYGSAMMTDNRLILR